jgi:hypothetical protein
MRKVHSSPVYIPMYFTLHSKFTYTGGTVSSLHINVYLTVNKYEEDVQKEESCVSGRGEGEESVGRVGKNEESCGKEGGGRGVSGKS